MSMYVDGYVIPVPKRKLKAYLKMARAAAKIWTEFGALDYKECVGDDLDSAFGMPFPKGIDAKRGETVVFSWIVYKSKSQRDLINKKVMADPRMAKLCDPTNPPFDFHRILNGGFKVAVSK